MSYKSSGFYTKIYDDYKKKKINKRKVVFDHRQIIFAI
jgi:hypothetical protein